VADDAFEIQMLHGMGDPIKAAVRAMGLRLREYAPVGELIPGMAYFVRRLLENTANESFLRDVRRGRRRRELDRAAAASADSTSRAAAAAGRRGDRLRRPRRVRQPAARRLRAPREPPRRRRGADGVRSAGSPALVAAASTGATRRPPVSLDSVDPAAPGDVLGSVAYGGPARPRRPSQAARRRASPAGATRRRSERAGALPRRRADARRARGARRARDARGRQDRREADADVDEAIDFLEYYGREMLRLGTPRRMGHAPASTTTTSTSRAAWRW
jgi:RHH-type proline utilization regulon transcriptional repressor/proline dehydrogenase/delta 1-pyrroline-5-carboxylate dehydrogenase